MAFINIQRIHCYHFEMPLAHPYFVRAEKIDRREGLVVHVISEHGQMGFGEISPLAGVSRESLRKAGHQAELLAEELRNARLPMELPLLLEWFSRRLPADSICPSTRFGFETAILGMVAALQGKAVCEFLKPGVLREITSAGLLQGSLADVVRQVRFLDSKGYRTFKLKVGSRNIPLDVQKVDAIRRILPPDARLRLDANRGWRLDEARMFMEHIGKDRIEYVEEPLADPVQLENFVRLTDAPVALDETVQEFSLEGMAGRLGITHVVARPMQAGGVAGYLDLLDKAGQLGLNVVLTASFESAVGMTVLANLAALTHTIPNLGTANWFDEDLLRRPVVVDAGIIPTDRFLFDTKFFNTTFLGQLRAV
ncbi:MAG: o-succinylbenzoate synthase [Candidatus Omnitrophota bacterium]